MSRWFDELCLRMAGSGPVGSLPRRNFLRGALSGAALGALNTASPSLGQRSYKKPGQSKTPTPDIYFPGRCTRSWAGNAMSQGVQLEKGGVTYKRHLQYDRSTNSIVDTIELTHSATSILSATVTVQANGASTTQVRYGAAVTGVRTANLTSTNGREFRGTIDGRAIRSTVEKHAAAKTEFLDHRAPPDAKAVGDFEQTVGLLGKQVRGKFTSCEVTTAPGRRGPYRPMDIKPGGDGSPGDGWYNPGETYGSPDCDGCWNNCVSTAEQYSGLDDWETYLCPVCFAAAVASFDVIVLVCWGTCQLPGGACCPVPCGQAFSCCAKGDHCFAGNTCCPASMMVCSNVCCGPNITSCAPDGTCGCPGGLVSCGEYCCPQGQICCSGPKGQTCVRPGGCDAGGCGEPTFSCNGKCCAPFSTCCNGQCCGAACVNNTCCPAAQVCGNTCCSSGQTCSSGKCVGCAVGYKPCQSAGPKGVNMGVCCSVLSPTCCGGVCCDYGMGYCVAQNGTYVCTKFDPHPIK